MANVPMTRRLCQIDEITVGQHHYLRPSDFCYYIGEYTRRGGYNHSETNQLIFNLKKPMNRRGRPDWPYKARAIATCGAWLAETMGNVLEEMTLVPVPPSKARDDPEYDDRMLRVCQAAASGRKFDIRDLVVQTGSRAARHLSDGRRDPADLEALYRIDESLVSPTPEVIGVIDDVLNTGSGFRAISSVLQRRFPEASIAGIFIARCLPDSTDPMVDFEALLK